tara:strand:- start:4984 stop:5325 length:342 start_codon:yes stop_codon:yes gene_type:complete
MGKKYTKKDRPINQDPFNFSHVAEKYKKKKEADKKELQKELSKLKVYSAAQAKEIKAKKKKVRVPTMKELDVARVPWSSPTAGRNIRSKHYIGKKFNMGGVMKNRGGTFKGVF